MAQFAGGFSGKRVADIGCGYRAEFARTLIPAVAELVLVDLSLAPDLNGYTNVIALEGRLPDALGGLPSGSLDVVMCNNVLEHLWEPLEALVELRRITAATGVLLINVPSWRGKRFLEVAAFRLKTGCSDEMNDHKMYYDPRDLWPLLVRAGFRPEGIRCFRHKLGMNTFAACRSMGSAADQG
jgi:SAM-dependent methyltransferase